MEVGLLSHRNHSWLLGRGDLDCGQDGTVVGGPGRDGNVGRDFIFADHLTMIHGAKPLVSEHEVDPIVVIVFVG